MGDPTHAADRLSQRQPHAQLMASHATAPKRAIPHHSSPAVLVASDQSALMLSHHPVQR